LNQIVREIKYSKEGAEIFVEGYSEPIRADAVVVTVSLGVLKSGSIRFEPPLPEYKQASIDKLGFGIYDKVFVEFESPIEVERGGFWPTDTGTILIVPYDDDDVLDTVVDEEELEELSQSSPSVKASPITTPRPYTDRDPDHIGMEMVNLSDLAGKPKLVMLIYDEVAAKMEEFAHDERLLIEYAQQKLDNAFNNPLALPRVPKVIHAYASTWGSNPLACGSFANIPVGASGQDMRNLSLPVEGRLMFAGEASFPMHYSTVHGALKSGRREFARLMKLFFPNEPTPFAELLRL
jgi:lysine-specific histone demethylase 1